MKSFYFMIMIVICVSCNEHNNAQDTPTSKENIKTLKLNGTWEMVGYYNYVNNQIADSFKTNRGFRQVKMYTDSKVMWSKIVPSDSIDWFGYGNYRIRDNNRELIEILEYGSEMMCRIIQEKKEFKYELHLDKNKFSQIEVDAKGNRIYSENYRRIE